MVTAVALLEMDKIAMQRAWTIMNRYFEFMKRGGEQPLPKAEFPTLAD